MATEAVCFDFYGTLVHFGDYHLHATARFLNALGIDEDPEAFFDHWNEHFYALKDRLVERDEFLPIWHMYGESMDRAFEERGLDVGGGELSEAVHICMETLPDFLERAPGVEETLQALDGDYTLAVVSNADEDDLQSQLDQAGLRGYFDVIVSSEQAQAYKPHPRIFEIALDRMELAPAETAFVGDNLQWDIKGANGLGITSIWYNRDGAERVDGIEPTHEVRELAEIPGLLG